MLPFGTVVPFYICNTPFRVITFFNGAATYPPVPCGKVLSAVAVLTVVFGMGTGVAPPRIATPNPVIDLRSVTYAPASPKANSNAGASFLSSIFDQ